MRANIELAIQRALIFWMEIAYPTRVKVVANLNEYARNAPSGIGVDVGSPDLMIYTRVDDPLTNGTTHFFFLELKKKRGKLSDPQIEWNSEFDADYRSDNCTRAVAYGFDEAKYLIREWLESVGVFSQEAT